MHLALNFKQKPFLGVVLIPEREELWIAARRKIWCEKKMDQNFILTLLKVKILKRWF